MDQILSSKEFVIAGLLNEGPCHGYEIEQKIKSRGMRNWTQIGFSSIYHILGKLKKANFVSQNTNIVKGKLQQVFQLTPAGKQALHDQIRLSIITPQRDNSDFDVAISNTVDMPSEEVRQLLNQRIANLKEEITTLERLHEDRLNSGMPTIPSVTILFDRPIAFLKAEIDFLKTYLNRF
ncbi:MAG: PadR family transcriptional regulator [Fidelibacterota bacterium]